MIKVYFKGDSGIENPTDINGSSILEGDILTTDYGDYESYMHKPIPEHYLSDPFYLVKKNENGGYFAESIEPMKGMFARDNNQYFFLHDFRFKYCKKL